MVEKVRNFINGKWVNAAEGRMLKSINPADTTDTVGIIPRSGQKDIDMAVTAARNAYNKWRLTPAPGRGEIILKAAELLCKRKQELGGLVTREMGKVLPEGLREVQEAIDMAYYMGSEGRRLSGETVPSELPNKDAKSIRVPIGVFALITPWNFPIAIPAWKLCPALVAGNTVVLKPSRDTAVCATRLVEIFAAAGVPAGVLNLVHGSGPEAGEDLVAHAGIDAVSFTGSCDTGEHLEGVCGGMHRHISAEMGGKNAIIVMDDVKLELAVEGAIWGGFGTTGQRCTAASRLVVHEAVYNKFLSIFTKAASKLRLGNGLLKTTDVGPVINDSQMEKVLDYIEIGKKEKAKLVIGGKAYKKGPCTKGYFIEPTIFADVTPKMRIAQEEIFGPVVSVMKAKNLEDAIRIVNDVKYGLSSAIYTQDVNNSAVAERDLDTGLVYINASTIGAEIQLPFGGTKKSGLGHREAGGKGGAIDMFTKWKVIYRDYSGRLQKAQIDKD